ncbi:methyltransferase [Xylella taiwanensis]|nr:methyltransferase [Xylella taiwanensis]
MPDFTACSTAAAFDPALPFQVQRTFDSVAAKEDGSCGHNVLIQRMRASLREAVAVELSVGARLIDLGCGTGLDAQAFAQHGYRVLATDGSAAMVARTRQRAQEAGLDARLRAVAVGIEHIDQLRGEFDGIYSNFGSLNHSANLPAVAVECARLLRSDGCLVFAVIGRICPWEMSDATLRGRLMRAGMRLACGATAMHVNANTLWIRRYLPREFYQAFAAYFSLEYYRPLSVFLPPPYLVDVYQHYPVLGKSLGWLDDRIGTWPLLRDMGDYFLIVMRKRSTSCYV